MLESIFQSFEKLISEFSWRRLVFLVLLLVITVAAIWLWENSTGQMRLTRIERTILILNSIKDLQEHPVVKSDPILRSTLLAVKEDLKEFTERRSETPILDARWRKAFAGGAPWLLFSLLYLPAFRTKEREELNALIGCLTLSVIFGVIGAWLPDFSYPWVNFIGYPVANFILIVAFALWWQARKRAHVASHSIASKQEAAQTSR